ncbi:MAG TPA: hypothetical protein VGX27_13975 [Candidatus Dormibacteraeota bacterium]|nr:hypothetical protein [Candidatus Dormibacteraeota bacterium]
MKLGPRPLLTLLRIYLYGVLAALIVFLAILPTVQQLTEAQATDLRLLHQVADQQATIAEQESTIEDLKSRWIGDPALWQPTNVPSNVSVEYFDVTGTTQTDLIDALNNSGLCQKYACLPDPALPPGSPAWALEGDSSIYPPGPYCYSAKTNGYHWGGHTVTMPRWSPKLGSVKITLVVEWNALEQAMWIHELGHVQVSEDWLASLNAQAQQLSTCEASVGFWRNLFADPHFYDSLDAAQNAYHAKLRADCRPEIGCIPYGWMGW